MGFYAIAVVFIFETGFLLAISGEAKRRLL